MRRANPGLNLGLSVIPKDDDLSDDENQEELVGIMANMQSNQSQDMNQLNSNKNMQQNDELLDDDIYDKFIEEGEKIIEEIKESLIGVKQQLNSREQREKQKLEEEKQRLEKEKLEIKRIEELKQYYQMQELNKPKHIGIKCSYCNKSDIAGARYLCSKCFDYNLCEKCEDTAIHAHPMFKLKTEHQFKKLIEDLKKKNLKIEEEKKEIEELKIIANDLINKSKIGMPIIKEADIKIFGPSYDIYSDEILKQLKSKFTKVSPQSGYTISTDSSDICMSFNIKNNGKIAWPKGFKISTLNTDKNAIDSKNNYTSIHSGEEILLEIYINNPKSSGNFTYVFTLSDVDGRKFGDQFEFEFKVKESVNKQINSWAPYQVNRSSYSPYPYDDDNYDYCEDKVQHYDCQYNYQQCDRPRRSYKMYNECDVDEID